jgi:hypothetical protein
MRTIARTAGGVRAKVPYEKAAAQGTKPMIRGLDRFTRIKASCRHYAAVERHALQMGPKVGHINTYRMKSRKINQLSADNGS